jgi:hypothetical protein
MGTLEAIVSCRYARTLCAASRLLASTGSLVAAPPLGTWEAALFFRPLNPFGPFHGTWRSNGYHVRVIDLAVRIDKAFRMGQPYVRTSRVCMRIAHKTQREHFFGNSTTKPIYLKTTPPSSSVKLSEGVSVRLSASGQSLEKAANRYLLQDGWNADPQLARPGF